MKKMVGFIGLAFFAPPRLAGATPTSRLYALPDLSREVYEEYLLAREVPERLGPLPCGSSCRKELILCLGLHRPRYNPTLDILDGPARL